MTRPQNDSREIEIFHFVPQLRDGYDQLGTGIFDLFGELMDRVDGVGGGGDGADGHDTKEAERELDGIRCEDEDDVVLADAKAEQTMGDFHDRRLELGEG